MNRLSISFRRLRGLAQATVPVKMSHMGSVKNFTEIGKKIVGAGINYRSMILDRKLPTPAKPIIFLKATTSYIQVGENIQVPKGDSVNYEVELGVVIGERCRNVSESEALNVVAGYCLALDMTNISLLNVARGAGEPWALGKSFDTSCPVGKFIPKSEISNPGDVKLWLKLNNKLCQNESTSDMIFSTQELISFVSTYMTLEPGDLILTGSPAGVGPVSNGDVIDCGLDGLYEMSFKVEAI